MIDRVEIKGIKGEVQVHEHMQYSTDEHNVLIKFARSVSDGYHTFDELYDHRITLFLALCRQVANQPYDDGSFSVWRSKYHYDGELCFGTGTQYALGIGKNKGQQITYHIPIERWNETDFAETLDKAPEWDGHTSADVLERLKSL